MTLDTETTRKGEFNQDQFLASIEELVKERGLWLGNQAEQATALVISRVKELEARTPVVEIPDFTGIYQGFIHPDSIVRISSNTLGFRIDDPEIYQNLLWSAAKFFNRGSSPNPSIIMAHGLSFKQAISYVVFDAVRSYFNADTSDEDKDLRRILQHTTRAEDFHEYWRRGGNLRPEIDLIHLRDIKAHQTGMCVEYAAVALNLLSVMGEDGMMINTQHCQLPKGSEESGHAYDILRGQSNHWLYDVAQPSFYADPYGLTKAALVLYPLSEAEFQRLMDGGEVEVRKHDLIERYHGSYSTEPADLVYSGPDLKRDDRDRFERLKKGAAWAKLTDEQRAQEEKDHQKFMSLKMGFDINEPKNGD